MSRRFTQGEILEIRSKRAAGLTQPQLALEYNCSVNTIRSIEKGLSYRDVGGFEQAPPDEALASEMHLLALMREQGLDPNSVSQPEPDPLEVILARAKPMSESLSLIRERQAADDADALARGAELLKGLKSLRNAHNEQSQNEHESETSDSPPDTL